MLIFLLLICLALLGVPLFAVLAVAAMYGFYSADIDLAIIAIEVYRLAEMPVLVAIPLFTFAGYLLGESKAPQRLVRLSSAVLAVMPGGLAIIGIVTCALFTAFTGASGVTIVALGGLLYAALIQAGYSEKFSLGLITSSGSLGILFAPSLPLILYAVVVQQLGVTVSVEQLFLAGIVPGLLMLVLLAIWGIYHAPKRLPATQKPATGLDRSLWLDALPELPLPFVVLIGIYSGCFAISDAAAVAAIYVFLVEVVIRREIAWKDLPKIMRDSMALVGGILLILGVSLATTNYIVDAQVPGKLFTWVSTYISSKWTFLIALNVFLLLLGMALDIFSALVIMLPLLLPIATAYGVSPIHLGIIFLANMQLGYFTPPVGMNLFIASYRFEKPIMTLWYSTFPFFCILLVAVLIITYVPALSFIFLD